MKTYSRTNFFKHTFCEFIKVDVSIFNENKIHFKSKAGSMYSYTKNGVYRYSNHWGKVANCRWKLIADEKIKNQEFHLGFANWSDFFPLNENEKQFYLLVDFEMKEVRIQHKKQEQTVFLFYGEAAQKRARQIKKIFEETAWAKYYASDIDKLRKAIVTELTQSNKSLQQIKKEFLNTN